jgi:transcriptional regulator with XRE-family HTH domain
MPKEKVQRSNPEKETKSHNIPDIDRDYIKKIAARAKELRIKSGNSYEQFAIHAGINRNSYFRFEKKSAESGENFTIALLLKITRGLNITMTDFFQDIK